MLAIVGRAAGAVIPRLAWPYPGKSFKAVT
jgi:hypothetical protein